MRLFTPYLYLYRNIHKFALAFCFSSITTFALQRMNNKHVSYVNWSGAAECKCDHFYRWTARKSRCGEICFDAFTVEYFMMVRRCRRYLLLKIQLNLYTVEFPMRSKSSETSRKVFLFNDLTCSFLQRKLYFSLHQLQVHPRSSKSWWAITSTHPYKKHSGLLHVDISLLFR